MLKNFKVLCLIAAAGTALVSCNKEEVIPDTPAPEPPAEGTSVFQTNVFEYMPAPGQFVGEPEILWNADAETARQWAQERLAARNYVSLGSFGGYIVVGFDHHIRPRGGDLYDFAVEGNAFLSEIGSSNEPGVVWVMQDTNGNGQPDDVWYQLKGSEYGTSTERMNFSVTYTRPEGEGMDVPWTDSDGKTGVVKYLPSFHKQPFYYPAWAAASYTLSGTCLRPRNAETSGGYWSNEPYDWGYADNCGSDSFTLAVDGKEGRFTGFRISNAVDAQGNPAGLSYIDFVKVQSAVLASNAMIGEVSTEVLSVVDLNFVK